MTMLYIVATPIGNLDDISARALAILKNTTIIIAENPGHSQKLLNHYGIKPRQIIQFAEHNEAKILDSLISLLKGQDACLISDAGTPTISDPGFRLVRACRKQGIVVSSIPGANAAITALSGSGLPTDKFWFVGFFPKTAPKLKSLLDDSKNINSTLVGYESPQRIKKTIELINKLSPTSIICLSKELTKIHEEYITGSADEILAKLQNKPGNIKGEFTVIISHKQ